MSANLFNGKVVLVTGASSGIGKAAALSFAREGANLVLADTQTDGGTEVARKIESLGRKVTFVKCDVSSESDVKNLMAKVMDEFGRLDCAFNDAGIEGKDGNTADCSSENWDQVINTNLKGVWLCMKYELAQMQKQKNGSIVNCSSIAGLIGFPGSPAYVAAKHGVIGLTKTAALEYAKANLRVNAVCPGVIETPMVERYIHNETQKRKKLTDGEPMGRLGRPEEVAQAALWLCSDAASFITGHSLVVDGGWTAQ